MGINHNGIYGNGFRPSTVSLPELDFSHFVGLVTVSVLRTQTVWLLVLASALHPTPKPMLKSYPKPTPRTYFTLMDLWDLVLVRFGIIAKKLLGASFA